MYTCSQIEKFINVYLQLDWKVHQCIHTSTLPTIPCWQWRNSACIRLFVIVTTQLQPISTSLWTSKETVFLYWALFFTILKSKVRQLTWLCTVVLIFATFHFDITRECLHLPFNWVYDGCFEMASTLYNCLRTEFNNLKK